MLIPRSRLRRITLSKMWLRLCGSTPTVGSSRNSSRGWWTKPRGDVDAALHPAGEVFDGVVGAVGQGDDAQHVIHAFLEVLAPQAVDAPEKVQVGAGAEGGVEGQVLGYQAVDLFDLVQVWVLMS